MPFLWATLLILAMVLAWLLTLFGLPGNWLIVAAAAVYAYLVPPEAPFGIGWGTVGLLAALATLGELVEFLSGASRARKAGGSRRGTWYSLVGSILGGLLGIFVGLPIPVIGSVVAALLFAPLGALAGAVLGERSEGREGAEAWRIGQAAFWG